MRGLGWLTARTLLPAAAGAAQVETTDAVALVRELHGLGIVEVVAADGDEMTPTGDPASAPSNP